MWKHKGAFLTVIGFTAGGSAEYVTLWVKQAGSESLFYWYVTALCAIAGLVSFRMRDPSKVG
ncbi:hypothetical protein LMG29739_05954 [Paraburkholderia solisilvae]|uniref:Alpha-ketoglutarate permease n=1 Tax=Paraburkholderia solisilvae TaxID=624376 RepID=A0A6J5F0A3_9BURK|nr:hypothetical protein LMG29739_05954 [Paraburkholderia solisilvae]